MKVTRIDIDTKLNEWHNLTPLSDLHIDSAGHDDAALDDLINDRNKLDNHRYITLGDTGNWVMPKDLRRFTPSVPALGLRGREDYINGALDMQRKRLRDLDIDLMCLGNHETAMLKHHSIDVVQMLCRDLGVAYGGYSGYLIYRLRARGKVIGNVSILYHHGAWGGRVVKGYGGARDWGRHFDGWDLFLFGHNHMSAVWPESRLAPQTAGHLVSSRDVYTVACGTHQRGYTGTDATGPDYAEVKGYAPTTVGAPLVSFRVRKMRFERAKRIGKPQTWTEVKVRV